VAAVCRSGYYQLRQLRPLVRSMSAETVKTLVQAFISCRLDYCNSLFYGINDGLMSRLQSVQNAAARLVSGHTGVHVGTTTSRRCYRSCIGFRFDVEWSSSSPLWTTCHCPAWPQPVSWSPTKVAVSCVLRHRGRVLSDGLQQLWRQVFCGCRS